MYATRLAALAALRSGEGRSLSRGYPLTLPFFLFFPSIFPSSRLSCTRPPFLLATSLPGPTATGSAGLINTVSMLSQSHVLAGVFGVITSVGWAGQTLFGGWLYKRVWDFKNNNEGISFQNVSERAEMRIGMENPVGLITDRPWISLCRLRTSSRRNRSRRWSCTSLGSERWERREIGRGGRKGSRFDHEGV